MKGLLSFHPVDLRFFDEVVSPLVAGRKINPEPFVAAVLQHGRAAWAATRWTRALTASLAAAAPPELDPAAPVWRKLRHRLDAFDFRPDRASTRAAKVLESDLHLEGRPFLIAEGSAESVAAVVDRYRAVGGKEGVDRIAREQLRKLDAELAEAIEPEENVPLESDYQLRADLLGELKGLHDLAFRAREGGTLQDGPRAGDLALDVLVEELPWRALRLHARGTPFWIARDVDGLETTCRAAAMPPPTQLVPAWRLFAEACEQFPALKTALTTEVRADRCLGGFVAPAEVAGLLEFLEQDGVRIIAAAARHGEGRACATLLRKIKECAFYASRHGLGYVEASGILPSEE